MKSISILALVIGLTTTTIFAQEEPMDDKPKKEKLNPEERADKRTAKMVEILELTPEQEEEVRAINLAHSMEMEKIHEEMKALKKRAKELRKQTKSEIEEVLTKEQREKLEEERKAHHEERKRKRKERCCQEDE